MSKSIVLENEKCKFLRILNILTEKRVEVFTQNELSIHLKISRKKLVDFEKGRILDFWLLCRYADLVGEEIKFLVRGIL